MHNILTTTEDPNSSGSVHDADDKAIKHPSDDEDAPTGASVEL